MLWLKMLAPYLAVAIFCVARSRRSALAWSLVAALSLNLLFHAHLNIDTKTHLPARPTANAPQYQSLATLGGLSARVMARDFGIGHSYHYQRHQMHDLLLPNMAGVSGLLDAQGFDPAIPRRTRLFFDLLNAGGVNLYPSQM